MVCRAGAILAALLLTLSAPRSAEACGVGSPLGPTACEGKMHASGSWFLGASGSTTDTTLSFDGDREYKIVEYVLAVSLGYVSKSGWSFRASLGTVLEGTLEGKLEGVVTTHNIDIGIVGAGVVSKRWAFNQWFVTGSIGAGLSRATTVMNPDMNPEGATELLVGLDALRVGVMMGRAFGFVSPYVAARGFTGPVQWTLDNAYVTGTDKRRYQLGGGLVVTTESGASFLFDVSGLGERSASLGMAYRL